MSLAAKYLKTDATTVSRRVSRLSSEYGTNLFRKAKGQWVLTDAGVEFVRAAHEFNHALENLGRVVDGQLSGQSVILNTIEFVVDSYLVPNISKLHALQCGMKLTMTSADRRISLAYGEADIALRLNRPNEGRLIGSKIGSIEMGLFAPPGRKPDAWVGLSEELDWTPEMRMGFDYYQKAPDMRVPSFTAMRKVATQLGYATVGPIDVMTSGGVLAQIHKGSTTRDVWSVIHETRRDDHVLKVVREWARDCLNT